VGSSNKLSRPFGCFGGVAGIAAGAPLLLIAERYQALTGIVRMIEDGLGAERRLSRIKTAPDAIVGVNGRRHR